MHIFHVDIHLIKSEEMLATFFTIEAVQMFAFLEGFRTIVAGTSFLMEHRRQVEALDII